MEVEKLVEEIKSLEISPENSLEWWNNERISRIERIINKITSIESLISQGNPKQHLEELHNFLRILQHSYKMHDKNIRVHIKTICRQKGISSMKELDDWIDGVCNEIRNNIKQNPKISLVVSMWNGSNDIIEMTENMFFNSVIRSGLPEMEIIIVDDGSPPEFQQKAKEMMQRIIPRLEAKGHHVLFIQSPVNLGYTHSYNAGLRRATGDVVFVSNTDIMVSQGAMQEMLKLLMKDPEVVHRNPEIANLNVGIVGPMLTGVANYAPQQATRSLFINSYEKDEIERVEKYTAEFNRLNANAKPAIVKVVMGSFMVFKREVFSKTGFFDEKFKQGYAEETDFCYKAQKKGFSVIVARNVFVYHGGVNRSKLSEQMDFSGQSTSKKFSHFKNQVRAILNERHFLRNHGIKAWIEKTRLMRNPKSHKGLDQPILPKN
ncbi:glycosyltransferase family 2 protein [Candidatus Woesearchaeota archaeon]|nr:glycosyltransferase family 2 protein [Candidatus Woesearchaeota archaeon]